MKILITGFEPFGGEKINPAWEAVNSLPSKIDDIDIDDLDEELDTNLSLDEDSISNQPIQILVRPVQVLEVEQKNVS